VSLSIGLSKGLTWILRMKMPSLRMTQTLISAEALVLYLQTQSSWNVKAPFLKYHLYIFRAGHTDTRQS
jgi:hypothetical protein